MQFQWGSENCGSIPQPSWGVAGEVRGVLEEDLGRWEGCWKGVDGEVGAERVLFFWWWCNQWKTIKSCQQKITFLKQRFEMWWWLSLLWTGTDNCHLARGRMILRYRTLHHVHRLTPHPLGNLNGGHRKNDNNNTTFQTDAKALVDIVTLLWCPIEHPS
jgi:hypothetical protein